MNSKQKYFYFFPSNLEKHFNFYSAWVREARKLGLPIKLLTTIKLNVLIKERKKIKKLIDENHLIILPKIPFLENTVLLIYLTIQILTNKKVVIHVRKRDPRPLRLLKLLSKKLKISIELEGDAEAEKDYLIKHPYKEGFYYEQIKSYNSEIKIIKDKLQNADAIFCVTKALQELISNRYEILEDNITVLPTGVDSDIFYYNIETRNKIRNKLQIEDKFVMVFSGSAFYSWQNINKTLRYYKIIKDIEPSTLLILLIRESDHYIVNDFIQKNHISKDEIVLKSVSNKDVNDYLNAADLGILLRDNHLMNKVAFPGKLGEYLAAGLPVLTTVGIGEISKIIEKNKMGIVLEDINSESELVEKFLSFKTKKVNRDFLSSWARTNLSNQSKVYRFVNTLKQL